MRSVCCPRRRPSARRLLPPGLSHSAASIRWCSFIVGSCSISGSSALQPFWNCPQSRIGRIGGGRNKPTGLLDVAVIQSLVLNGVVDDRVGEHGQLIIDYCHHLSPHTLQQVVRRAKSRFVVGLFATV